MTVWCFQCGTEYDDDSVAECDECGVPTVTTEPVSPSEVGSPGEEQLAYELHSWAGTSRRMLDGLLDSAKVEHAWQGATLIVREADEEAVDEAVEAAMLASMPKLDPEKDTMVYELDDFSDEQIARIAAALGEAGLAHDFDGDGDLVVHEFDEEAVDAVFESLDAPVDDDYVFGPGVEGVDAHEVLSGLFLAAQSLRRNAANARAVEDFASNADLAEELQLPFGFSAADWRALLDQVSSTRAGLESNELEADEVHELVESTYNQLRPLV